MFSRPTRTWFSETFAGPTEVQRLGWPVVAGGAHALLVAPTGSGKTLAAFLAGIDSVARLEPDAPRGARVLYVSPLKALVYDIERNLRAPLSGIARTAERLGLSPRAIGVDVRTGDTPQRDRRRQLREPGEILVTTPESLFLLLGSRARETLRSVHTVIVDEIHALAPTKRGTHLALSLERLAALALCDPQRIGLSATVRPLDAVARYLGGDRPVEIVDASAAPTLDVRVVVPVPDMDDVRVVVPVPARDDVRAAAPIPDRDDVREPAEGPPKAGAAGAPPVERGIWPAIYPELVRRVREHRSTLIFVNSRGLCERLAQRLNALAGEELVLAHHGSVSHARRAQIEEGLKAGRLRGIVATSSLELGIDMGAVDLVLLVESPGSVARGLQRVGRAGHDVGTVSVGHIFPKFRGDLLECAVVASRMRTGEIEALEVPRNVLDVLAQQIVAICCDGPRSVAEIEGLIRRADPFRDLSRTVLDAVLDMLTGRYPSTDFADLRPLLSWDRATDVLAPRRSAAIVSRMNAGTIPDRGHYGVFLGAEGPRVGELDEEMVYETRVGQNILLGASTWRVEAITRDRVVVTPAPGEPGRLPFWKGDGPGRPIELGRAIGAFVRRLAPMSREGAAAWLLEHTPLDAFAADNLAAYLEEQKEHDGALPTDRSITVERFRDELGDWRVCVLTPFGARIHAPWALALQRILASRGSAEVQVLYTDDGIVLRFADGDELPDLSWLFPDPAEAEERVAEQLAGTALYAGLFRENAVRSLLLPRRRPGQRNPLWAQRLKAQNLLAAVRRYPSFPIVLETYRQALSDVFDLRGLSELLRDVRSRAIGVHEVETRSASPFARSLVFAYVAAYMYESDAPAAERRAQALTVDRGLLAELLGQGEMRGLIDARVLADLEEELQRLTENRKARDADELHDLLRQIGDLTVEEIAARTSTEPEAGPERLEWLERLAREQRAVEVTLRGERRFIAAEDAGLYRDGLGAAPPSDLPESFLAVTERPVETLLARFAHRHGPFLTVEPAARYGLLPAQIEPILRGMEQDGLLVRGEIRPGGIEPEWCDPEVLRRLKRRTLVRLRDEVAPVDAGKLGLFLPRWHEIDLGRQGPERLLEAIAQLEGLPLAWSMLSQVLLPQRVAGFTLDMLDQLAASGALVWVGRGAAGTRDGRVALYLREHAHLLIPATANATTTAPAATDPRSPAHATILAHLTGHGASFFIDLASAAEREHPGIGREELRAALWDLVWDGHVTNDTFAPLRSFSRGAVRTLRGRPRRDASLGGGRWSLVAALVRSEADSTERAITLANVLLDRYGIVSREAALAEEVPGGFTTIYPVLKALEETGRVRRGYFVEGLSGAQFAQAGAVDRLRGPRSDGARDTPCTDEDVRVLAAIDPVNPYGALVPWPATGGGEDQRPRRVPGAAVILVRGRPALYLGPRGRSLSTFPETLRDEPGAFDVAVRALHALPRGIRRGSLVIEKIDGSTVRESEHFDRLRASGFETDYRGLRAEARY